MYKNAVTDSIMSKASLRQDYYNIISKIKRKFYAASGSAPLPPLKNSGCTPSHKVSEINFAARPVVLH